MPTNRVYRIAVIPGDGIGKEVVPEGVRVLEAAAKKFGFELRQDHFDFASYDYYEKHKRMMPEDWKDKIGGRHTAPGNAAFDADLRARDPAISTRSRHWRKAEAWRGSTPSRCRRII